MCSYVVRKPLVGQLVGGELDTDTVEVVVPLGPAFQGGDTLKGKQRAQVRPSESGGAFAEGLLIRTAQQFQGSGNDATNATTLHLRA